MSAYHDGNASSERGDSMKKVRIGNNRVPVVDGKTVAVFSAGRMGKEEAGVYHFWTAICIKKKQMPTVFGRALSKLDAGERFRRIGVEQKTASTASDRKAYSRMWQTLIGVVCVRPSTVKEVTKWLDGHEEDATHLKSLKFI